MSVVLRPPRHARPLHHHPRFRQHRRVHERRSPESLWDPNFVDSLASESSVESADIFATAMKNNFTVGHVVIDAILNGEL